MKQDVVRVELSNGVHRILVNGNVSIEYRPFDPERKKLAEALYRRLDAVMPYPTDLYRARQMSTDKNKCSKK